MLPERGYAPNGGGYVSEPEHFSGYNSDYDARRFATPDDKCTSKNKENQYAYGTVPRSR